MSRPCGLAVPAALLLVLLAAATATAAIKPLEQAPQDDGLPLPVDHLAGGSREEEEPAAAAARVASAEPSSLEPAARLADVRPTEKKDGGGDAAMPMEAASGVAIQGGDQGTVPKAGSGDGSGIDSGEHGKGESGGSGSSKEAEKSAAAKSCLTKEECHKKRLLCGKGCTLSAHAKCAAKCSKSCIPTC